MYKDSKQPLVVGLGEILWDLLPQGKELGGAPANFAFHAKELGASGFVVSRIGNDASGKEILSNLERIGLNQDYIQVDVEKATGTVEVQLDDHGKPEFIIHENVAWDHIQFNSSLQELAYVTDAVCFGSLAQRSPESQAAIKSFLNFTPPQCLRICDINIRQSFYNDQIILDSLRYSNCLKLNEDELPLVAQSCSMKGGEDDILAALIKKFNLNIIALTKGAEGSRLFTLHDDSFLAASEIKVADTVGAGDAFTAVLVMGLLRQLPLKTIHYNANRLAAYVCNHKGATPQHSEKLKLELLNNQ